MNGCTANGSKLYWERGGDNLVDIDGDIDDDTVNESEEECDEAISLRREKKGVFSASDISCLESPCVFIEISPTSTWCRVQSTSQKNDAKLPRI